MENRILIVEDDYFVALVAEETLLEAGFKVIGPVASGEAAVERGLSERPDLVVMDIRLEGTLTGIDAARILAEHGIRSLFATAHSDSETVRAGEMAGPVGWLTKPFSASQLVGAVAAGLAQAGEPRDRPG